MNEYEVKRIKSSPQLLHCLISDRAKDQQQLLTAVYGFNTMELRKSLWMELNELAPKIDQPWLIIGDFNAILSPQDRLPGAAVTLAAIKDFKECVQNIGVTELSSKVNFYSWSNK